MRLSDRRYEEIKRTIADLLEDYGVRKIPIDVFKIAEKMHIKIIYSSKILRDDSTLNYETDLAHLPDSYLAFDPIKQIYCIYIDDVGTQKKRQRFSMAHELMHIVLGHSEQNPINESEANFGASYLLAPTSLALIKTGNSELFDTFKVNDIFDVSQPESKIIVRYNTCRVAFGSAEAKDYEITINSLLEESLCERISYLI